MKKISRSHLKIVYLIFIFAFNNILVKAQEETKNTYTPQVIPATPESQIFERYINHEIDEVSGTPSINIPLYEVNIKGLTIPITLSYDASGIKFDQFDGTIAVGWSIQSMGYRVFREIHGRPDDKYPFYKKNEIEDAINYHDSPSFGYYFLSLLSSSEYSKIRPQSKYPRQDSEYDIFSYLLPSSSGNFIITDRTKLSTAIIDKNRDKIVLNKGYTYPFDNQVESIWITDENGFRYELGGRNLNAYWRTDIGDDAYNGWALKKVVSPYGETIEFEYDVIDSDFRNRKREVIGLQVDNAGHYIKESYTSLPFSSTEIPNESRASTEFYLKKIKTPNTIVEFVYNEAELPTTYPSLKTIIIKNNLEQEIKRFGFNYYDYGHGYGEWHRMLASVEEGKGTEKIKKYSLDYFLPDVNEITKVTPDQWGYYSQSQNEDRKEFPLALHKELRDYKIRTQNNYQAERPLSFLGYQNFFDRSKNYGLLHSFSLKRITFPTGGYTEYEYESHKYKMENGTVADGGGQRVKRIISKPEESSIPVVTGFKYGENESGIGVANFPWLDESHFVRDSYYYEMEKIREGGLGSIGFIINVSYQISRSYMTNPLMPEFSKFKVSYKEISTYKVDTKNLIMTKTTSKYDIPEQYKYDGLIKIAQARTEYSQHTTQGNQVEVYDYSLGLKPLLRERIYYNDRLDITRKEEYKYDNTRMETYEGYKVRQDVVFHYKHPAGDLGNLKSGEEYQVDSSSGSALNPFTYVNQLCNYTPYYVKIGVNNLLLSKKITENGIVTEEKFNYDEYLQVKSISQYNSQAVERKEEYTYPYNLGEDIHKTMVNRNIITPVVEKNIIYNKKPVFFEKTHYTNMGSMILPSKIETSTQSTNNLRTNIIFDRYDSKGNLLQYTTPDGITTIILWSYYGQYPIAEIKGATYLEVETAAKSAFGVASIDALSQKSSVTEAQLNNFRNHTSVKNALVTTYTYKPLVGMSTTTDPRGVTTYYEYDSFGRLKDAYIEELDSAGNKVRRKVQSYNYYYQNK